MLDPRGYIESWNTGAEKIKGYTADEIIGKHFSIFYPEEDIQRDKPGYELKVAAEVGRFEDEGWRIRKDGSRFWANVVITALRDKDGDSARLWQSDTRSDRSQTRGGAATETRARAGRACRSGSSQPREG